MKKKIFFTLILALMLSLALAVSISAEVAIYTDAPAKTNIQTKTDEIVEFNDGFKCLSAYVFKDVNRIGDNGSFEGVMDFDYINGKLNKTGDDAYTYADVKGFDLPSGFTYVGKYAGRDAKAPTWVTFPNTVTGLGNAIFQSSTTLEECTLKFDENNSLKNFPGYMFYGCVKLKAFSMPDCFTTIYDMAHFKGCSSMTAVYLSKNLTKWQSNGSSYPGTFDDCGKMYFVNEPFTYGAIPEKPSVYYFPTGLTSNADDKMDFSNQSSMRNCTSINSTLVFGENVTRFNNAYFLQGSKVNIVFLGDMDVVAMGNGNWYKTTYYFANSADKSTENVTISTYIASYAVFCNAEGNTTHLTNPRATVTEAATCTTNRAEKTFCFCGEVITNAEVEGTMLGHAFDNDLGMMYVDYFANGAHTFGCTRCEETKDETLAPLFVWKGYSVNEAGKGITLSYEVDEDAIAAFEASTGKTVSYGFLVATGDNLAMDQHVMTNTFDVDYYMVEVVLNYGDIQGVDDVDVVMACSVTVGDETSYCQASASNSTSYTSSVYGTLYGASYNDLK